MKEQIKKFMDSIMCDCDGYKDHTISSPNLIQGKAEQFFLRQEPLDKETQERFDKLKNNSEEQCGVNYWQELYITEDDEKDDDVDQAGTITRILNENKVLNVVILSSENMGIDNNSDISNWHIDLSVFAPEIKNN